MSRLVPALGLGIMAAGLIATNIALYDTPVDISPTMPAPRTGTKSPADIAVSSTMHDTTNFAETFERPLFSPSRRKFVPAPIEEKPVEVASAPMPAQPQLQPSAPPSPPPSLLGISVSGGNAKALLQMAGGGPATWFADGETVDGWTISEIDGNQAVLMRDGQEARLSLYPAVPASPTGSANAQ